VRLNVDDGLSGKIQSDQQARTHEDSLRNWSKSGLERIRYLYARHEEWVVCELHQPILSDTRLRMHNACYILYTNPTRLYLTS